MPLSEHGGPGREFMNPTMATPRPALLCLWLAGMHATQLDALELYGTLAVSIRERHKSKNDRKNNVLHVHPLGAVQRLLGTDLQDYRSAAGLRGTFCGGPTRDDSPLNPKVLHLNLNLNPALWKSSH